MTVAEGPPPALAGNGPHNVSLIGIGDNPETTKSEPSRQEAFAPLAEIKRDSIWRLCRTAGGHLDRLLWAIDMEDDAGLRRECQALVSNVRAIAILTNDLTDGGAR